MEYTIIENDGYPKIIQADLGGGLIRQFTEDPVNSDYQAYLKRDEPKVEHLTEIPTV